MNKVAIIEDGKYGFLKENETGDEFLRPWATQSSFQM